MKPKLAFVIGSVMLIGLSVGCSSKDDVSYSAIRGDLSPELRATADRTADYQRHRAVMADMNMRSIWDDWARTWYIDDPSRLSPYPIINISGNPR